jgi:glutathione S-transferase
MTMITLFGFGAGFGLPEISPYVTKTEVQLKMAGLAYAKEPARPPQSPKGQLPFIDADGERVGDSTFIRGYLERTFGIDFDEGLDARQRAEAWAIERMCENQLAWTGIHGRWLIPENFAKGPSSFFAGVPDALRQQAQDEALESVRGVVRAVGVGRHCEAEIVALGVRSLAALSVILGERPYLMGERPCGADATVFGVLAFILTPFFDGELRRRAEGFGNLVAYVDRMMTQFYPEFAWRAETDVDLVAA